MRASRFHVISFGLAGVLAVGMLASVGVALADDGSAATGIGRRFSSVVGHRPPVLALRALLRASGLDRGTVKDGLKAGQTLDEIFSENGLTSEAVIAEALADLDARLEKAVAGGHLAEDRAASIREGAADRLEKIVTQELSDRRRGRLRSAIGLREVRIASDAIGLNPRSLILAIREGRTIASLAEESGVQPELVVAAMMEPIASRVEGAVAAGELDAGRAEDLKARLKARIEKFVYEGPGPRANRGAEAQPEQ